MTSKNEYLPTVHSSLRRALDRQDALLKLMQSTPGRTWTRHELCERLIRMGNKVLVESALTALLRKGRLEVAERGVGGSGKPSTYRVVVEQARETG